MATIRCILASSVLLVVLSGCSIPCSAPGELSQDPAYQCHYTLNVVEINKADYSVKGRLPDSLSVKGPRASESVKPYTFRVRDLDKVENQLEGCKKEACLFVRQGNSPYLELVPEER